MEKNLCVPYKGFKLSHITQGWSDQHKAFDIANLDGKSYGLWMVAMENCIVENMMGAEVLGDKGWEYDRGFGILLRSVANPEVKYSYWHSLPFFPVKKGDTVLRGQPICQMGNSGYVESNGARVEYEYKLKPNYPGTHCHLSCPKDTIDRIDWSIKVDFDLMTVISLTLFSISNFLKK
jgi:hypothetical protein